MTLPVLWVQALVPFFSTIVGAVVGGLVVHRLALRRESLGERRSRRVEHLITAWRGLMGAANRLEPLTQEQNDALETSLTDIMLLGQEAEISAAAEFIRKMGSGEQTNLDGVLEALRSSLRQELGLDQTPLPRDRVLRISWKQAPSRPE